MVCQTCNCARSFAYDNAANADRQFAIILRVSCPGRSIALAHTAAERHMQVGSQNAGILESPHANQVGSGHGERCPLDWPRLFLMPVFRC
jgi:hypothetical protein